MHPSSRRACGGGSVRPRRPPSSPCPTLRWSGARLLGGPDAYGQLSSRSLVECLCSGWGAEGWSKVCRMALLRPLRVSSGPCTPSGGQGSGLYRNYPVPYGQDSCVRSRGLAGPKSLSSRGRSCWLEDPEASVPLKCAKLLHHLLFCGACRPGPRNLAMCALSGGAIRPRPAPIGRALFSTE